MSAVWTWPTPILEGFLTAKTFGTSSRGTDPCELRACFTACWRPATSAPATSLEVGKAARFQPWRRCRMVHMCRAPHGESFAYAAVVGVVAAGRLERSARGRSRTTWQSQQRFRYVHLSGPLSAGTAESCCRIIVPMTTTGMPTKMVWRTGEELLGTFGWFSNLEPSRYSGGDGVNDPDEVQDNTDPNEPCTNLLDDDNDGLNNYFEKPRVAI